MGEERALKAFKRVGSRRNRAKLRNFATENGLKEGSQQKGARTSSSLEVWFRYRGVRVTAERKLHITEKREFK